MSLNYVGVKGGMVLFVADDPGPISSQTEQDTPPLCVVRQAARVRPRYARSGIRHDAGRLRPVRALPHARHRAAHHAHQPRFDVLRRGGRHRGAPVPKEGFERDPKWVIFPRRAYQAHGEINERLAAIAHDLADEPALAAFNPMFDGGREESGSARAASATSDSACTAPSRRRIRWRRCPLCRFRNAKQMFHVKHSQQHRVSASWRAACRPPTLARPCAWWKRAQRRPARGNAGLSILAGGHALPLPGGNGRAVRRRPR